MAETDDEQRIRANLADEIVELTDGRSYVLFREPEIVS